MNYEKWVVIDSGGRVMLKAVGEPQIVCTLETAPLKITAKIQARANIIAAAPELLETLKELTSGILLKMGSKAISLRVDLAKQAITKAEM